MKFCKLHKMKVEIRDEAKQLLRELNQSIELLSYEAKFKEDEKDKEEQVKDHPENQDDKIPDEFLHEDQKGKHRFRRKRKANNNVIYEGTFNS